jgi:hypothetical protein
VNRRLFTLVCVGAATLALLPIRAHTQGAAALNRRAQARSRHRRQTRRQPPTLNLGFSGSSRNTNRNATVSVSYRRQGASAWAGLTCSA